MKKTLLLIAVTFISVLTIQAQDMTLEEILESHFEAIGQDSLNKVSTMKITGKRIAQGMEFPFTVYFKRPNKIRVEVDIQGSQMIQAFNGVGGYSINPMTGSTEPQDLGEQELKEFKSDSDMDGKLYNYEKKGSTLELVGNEEMEGTEVFKLKLTEKPSSEGEEGNTSYFFIDSESFMILKTTSKKKMNGTEFEMDNFPGNYKQINGIAMPHSAETKFGGNTAYQMTIETVVFGEEMANEIFEKPVKEEGK